MWQYKKRIISPYISEQEFYDSLFWPFLKTDDLYALVTILKQIKQLKGDSQNIIQPR